MTTDTFTIPVLTERLHEAREALDKLIKKANRYGTPLTVTVGDCYLVKHSIENCWGERREVTVHYTNLLITGEAPRVGNFEFLARIELGEGGNLLDTRPGV